MSRIGTLLSLMWLAGCAGAGHSAALDGTPLPGDAREASPGAEAAEALADTPRDALSDQAADSDGRVEATPDAGPTLLGFPADHPLLAPGLVNIAHRGGALLRPEETLAAYEHAVEVGADVLEMDLHATKDGAVVLNHDATLDRTTDGTGRLDQRTWAELQQLDAGYRFTRDGGQTFPFRGQGVRMASFRQVLERFPDKLFSAELKQTEPPIVDAVLAVLAETGMEDRVILVSFSDKTVQAIRAKNPRVVTGAGMIEMLVLASLTDEKAEAYTPPCPFFQMAKAATTAPLLARAHQKGARVQAWTVNDAAEMRALRALGVDGIMSDDPELLESVLRE